MIRRHAVVFATFVLIFATMPGSGAKSAPIDPALTSGDYALIQVSHGTAATVAAHARSAGASDVAALTSIDVVTARITNEALRALRSDAHVTFVGADTIVVATDKDKEFESAKGKTGVGIEAIKAPDAWKDSTGRGVTVALMDTGVAPHPALAGTVILNLDFVKDGATAPDPGGHGTFMAGLIAAHGNDFRGVAPDAKIVSLRVLDAKGMGTMHSVLSAFDWLLHNRVAYGIRVLNLSFGAAQAASYHRELLAGVVESAHFAGVAVVAAAGNDGPKAGSISIPGADPFVLTVGSFADQGKADRDNFKVSNFSSRGPTKDGFVKPDLLAPGEHVLSLRVPGTPLDKGLHPGDPSDLARLTGTSASSAMISGELALIAQVHRAYTPTELKGAAVAGGRRIDGTKTPGADAERSLDVRPAKVNAGVAPSQVLVTLLRANGVALSDGIAWEGIAWEGIAWEGIAWEGIAWESVAWEGVSWESVSWETVTTGLR